MSVNSAHFIFSLYLGTKPLIMHHFSRLFFFVSIAVLSLTSCNPNDNNPDPAPTPTCKVVKSYAYDSGSVMDSSIYTYTNGKLTKVESSDYSITMEYTGEHITKRNFYDPGTTNLQAYEQVTYNSNGTISQMSRFSSNVEFERFQFVYSGDKLTKTTVWYLGSTGLSKEEEVSYLYTGNNVSKLYYNDVVTGAATDSVLLTHDSQPNYFRKQSSQFLLADPFFVDFEADILALLVSENNIIKAIDDPSNPSGAAIFSYTADTNGNLSTFSQDGELIFRYQYLCN
jgi:hypothetical protein